MAVEWTKTETRKARRSGIRKLMLRGRLIPSLTRDTEAFRPCSPAQQAIGFGTDCFDGRRPGERAALSRLLRHRRSSDRISLKPRQKPRRSGGRPAVARSDMTGGVGAPAMQRSGTRAVGLGETPWRQSDILRSQDARRTHGPANVRCCRQRGSNDQQRRGGRVE